MTEPGCVRIFSMGTTGGIVERLFPDRKWVLLRYAIVHIGGDDGRDRDVARPRYVCASSGKSLRRLPYAEVVILTPRRSIITTDLHTKVMPSYKHAIYEINLVFVDAKSLLYVILPKDIGTM